MGSLDGIRVLDLSQQLPGPYATLLLASLGAEVIKVEPPSGDIAREVDHRMFEIVNAGKRSVVLDLKQARSRDLLKQLVRGCDVLVEGFRPGTVARLGADYATVSALRPDIVYCSISGFGVDGPYRDIPGHDLNYLGVSGGATSRAEAQEIGIPCIDLGSGTIAALSIVAALLERERTGLGRYLDVALLDSAVFFSGVKVPPTGGAEPAYMTAAAADGLELSIAVIEDKFWRNICRGLGWSDWLQDEALATHERRRARAQEIQERLRARIAEHPRAQWLAELWEADVPVAPVNAPAQVALDPQVQARGLMDNTDGPSAAVPLAPLPFELRAQQLLPPPALGEHTEHILKQIEVGELPR
ncbi:MAG TPA: CoA transferase [Solirubrobacteraceae bacterium]|jgi:crotonobetainyl-CoA:carnitine CoA-transferase CaiB-like acyl-CoA transferase